MRRHRTIEALLLLGLTAIASCAYAHGERALEPFVRMRTIQWYDVAWSKADINVNDELVMAGKFHVSEDWPASLPQPDSVYLNVASPSPVFIRKNITLNGTSIVNSVGLKIGGDYEFSVTLAGRVPGRFHIHPMMNIRDVGVIVGPGQWITIGGAAESFKNEVTTLTGETIDLETYGTTNGVMWHLIWFAIAGAWLIWWIRRPLFIPRFQMVQAGDEARLVTPLDRRVAGGLLALTLLLVGAAYAAAEMRFPDSIPLQASRSRIEPLPVTHWLAVTVKGSLYRVAERSLKMTLEVTNTVGRPIRLGQFMTANVQFINREVGRLDSAYPEELMAKDGLRVESDSPIAPGETRTIVVTATDAAFDTERLSSVIKDADSRFGGLLFFYDGDGGRYLSSISAATIPVLALGGHQSPVSTPSSR
jgi:methane/ammonia monooxygenase subunit B